MKEYLFTVITHIQQNRWAWSKALWCSDNREPAELRGWEVNSDELLGAAFLSCHHHVLLFGVSKLDAFHPGTQKEREHGSVFNGDVFTHHCELVREKWWNGLLQLFCDFRSVFWMPQMQNERQHLIKASVHCYRRNLQSLKEAEKL